MIFFLWECNQLVSMIPFVFFRDTGFYEMQFPQFHYQWYHVWHEVFSISENHIYTWVCRCLCTDKLAIHASSTKAWFLLRHTQILHHRFVLRDVLSLLLRQGDEYGVILCWEKYQLLCSEHNCDKCGELIIVWENDFIICDDIIFIDNRHDT